MDSRDTFSAKPAWRWAWGAARQHWTVFLWPLLWSFLLLMATSAVQAAYRGEGQPRRIIFGVILFTVATAIARVALWLAMLRQSLVMTKEPPRRWVDLLPDARLFLNTLIVNLLAGLATLLGLLLLIVPGIILAIKFSQAMYLVVDQGLGPIAALRQSWQLTENVQWPLFLFGLAAILVNIAGILALLVGSLFTVPLTMLAGVAVYRSLRERVTQLPH